AGKYSEIAPASNRGLGAQTHRAPLSRSAATGVALSRAAGGTCRRFVKSKAAFVPPAGEHPRIFRLVRTPCACAQGTWGNAMKLPRRDFLHLAGATAVASAVPRGASALDYPNRPIHWIIGFPPGGGADIVSRIMGRWLSERLRQQVVIENKPGAGTNIATEAVVNASPDGYTMLWAGISNAINAMLYPGLS